MKIVAVGSPKGGVGKTTTAVHLARSLATRRRRVLLVDGDPIRSASEWAGDMAQVDVTSVTGADAAALARLRDLQGYDVAVVDLPGARDGAAWRALLRGRDGRTVPDLLIIPSRARVIELRPALAFLQHDVKPLGLPYLVVLMAPTSGLPTARARATELRGMGVAVAHTIVREYTVYDVAHETGRTVMDIGGVVSKARAAEFDQKTLADEVSKIIK